jgi:tetratricopeptide (TPR) repeat protein
VAGAQVYGEPTVAVAGGIDREAFGPAARRTAEPNPALPLCAFLLGVVFSLLTCLASATCAATVDSTLAVRRQDAALRGIDLFLNEHYDAAQALFDSMATAEPARPEAYLGKAMAYWDEGLIYDRGKNQKKEIERQIKNATRAAEAHIREHGESAEMYFWLGNAMAVRAGVGITYGDLIKAVLAGVESRDYLQEAVKRDPRLVDADFGLGLSDYVIARQPRLLRTVSRLFSLPSGDREQGLARLDRVAREGTYCKRHALSSRAFIALYYDKAFDEARVRFAQLQRHYPNSLDYRVRYLDAILALTVSGSPDYHRALADSARSIRQLASERGEPLEPWTRTKMDFIQGLGNYLAGDYSAARDRLLTYVREAEKDSWLLGPAELTLGKLADLRGDRESASNHYRKALRHDDVWAAHGEARAYLRSPFSGTEPSSRPVDPVKRYPQQP